MAANWIQFNKHFISRKGTKFLICYGISQLNWNLLKNSSRVAKRYTEKNKQNDQSQWVENKMNTKNNNSSITESFRQPHTIISQYSAVMQKPVHTVAEKCDNLSQKSDCCRKVRQSLNYAVVSPFRRQSHFFATVWTGLWSINCNLRRVDRSAVWHSFYTLLYTCM